jgi:ubiquinone/menaquinone biosynthesis C-methylase UbiE
MYKEKTFREKNNNSSYQIQRVSGHLQTEIDRLDAQVNLFWEKELKHYKEYGLKDGMSVVELGSGPGFLTEKLLGAFPGITINCLEIDPTLMEIAQQRLKSKYRQRVQMVHASIMNTELPGDTYDFAIVRLLIEHLPDPIRAAREVYRILKPAGKAVFIDNDFEMHLVTYPSIPGLRELYQAYCQARCAGGGNPRIGRELPIILKKAGFTNLDFEIIAAHSQILGDDIFFKSQGVGIPTQLVRDGYLSSKLLGEISVQWRNIVRNQDHAIIRQLYMGIGEKAI